MQKRKYQEFADRLISLMLSNGYGTSRSPRGVCLKTLSVCSGSSEQICRRYIRGDALPDHDKMMKIASYFKVSPGWLSFGEQTPIVDSIHKGVINDDLMRYILTKTLDYIQDKHAYVDFVMSIISEIREIDTTQENLERIVTLALESVKMYAENEIRLVQNEK